MACRSAMAAWSLERTMRLLVVIEKFSGFVRAAVWVKRRNALLTIRPS